MRTIFSFCVLALVAVATSAYAYDPRGVSRYEVRVGPNCYENALGVFSEIFIRGTAGFIAGGMQSNRAGKYAARQNAAAYLSHCNDMEMGTLVRNIPLPVRGRRNVTIIQQDRGRRSNMPPRRGGWRSERPYPRYHRW